MQESGHINCLVTSVENANRDSLHKTISKMMEHSYEQSAITYDKEGKELISIPGASKPTIRYIEKLCSKQKYSCVLQALIEIGKINPNYRYSKNNIEYCLLVNAACYGCKEVIQVLANNRVNLNAVAYDPRGKIEHTISAIGSVIENIALGKSGKRYLDTLQLLLGLGADPNYQEKTVLPQNETDLPLRHAIHLCPHDSDVKPLEESTKIFKIRSNNELSLAQDQEAHVENCKTIRSTMLEAIRLLVEYNADCAKVCKEGAIHPSARSLAQAYEANGDREFVRLLDEKGDCLKTNS